jgi:hypothetical protein
MSKVIEIDCSTGESVERDMTPAELEAQAAMQAQASEQAAINAEIEAHLTEVKASAKAKLIAGQPLTAEEADTLVL